MYTAVLGENRWTLVVPCLGLCVSLLWRSIIKSHADLNRVKFDVIHEFEEHLPAAMSRYEWQLAEEGQGKVYRAVSGIELWIPVLFAALHVVLTVVIFLEIVGVLG